MFNLDCHHAGRKTPHSLTKTTETNNTKNQTTNKQVSIGAVCATFNTVLTILYSLQRITVVLARTHLLPSFLAHIWKRRQTPAAAGAVTGGIVMLLAFCVPLDVLVGAVSLGTLTAVEFALMAGAESMRGAADAEKRVYPGGAFDPMGMSKGNLAELKTKEIKNGRLAMLACLGFVAQHEATGASPLAALGAHLAAPFATNFATNAVSIPFGI